MAIGTALAIAGIGLSAYGSYKEGKANKDAAKAQEKLNLFNAQVMEENAKATELKTRFDQVRWARQGRGMEGTLRAKLGASGADTSEGAPLAAMARQAFEVELQSALIGYEGQQQAAQYRSEAQAARMGAAVDRKRASNAMTAAYLNMGSTILGGFTQGRKDGLW